MRKKPQLPDVEPVRLSPIFGIRPGVVIFAAIEFLTGMTGTNTGVAHFAHLGGMLIGYLLMLQWRRRGNLFDKNSI